MNLIEPNGAKDSLRSTPQPQCELRLLLGPRRSGTTMILDLLSNHPEFGAVSRVISKSNKDVSTSFRPNYEIFSDSEHPLFADARARGHRFLVIKDETGESLTRGTEHSNECNLSFFPPEAALAPIRPAFVLRDPVRTFDSWLKVGWSDLDGFVTAYRTIWEHYLQTMHRCGNAFLFTYEDLTSSPERRREILSGLCAYWGAPFHEGMHELSPTLGEKFLFHSEREKRILEENPKGLFTRLREERVVRADLESHYLITPEQRSRIERELGSIYQAARCASARISSSEECTMAMICDRMVFFDVDGTLVNHHAAEQRAFHTVMVGLNLQGAVEENEAHEQWRQLAEETINMFLRGELSFEDQRRLRVSRFAAHYGVAIGDDVAEFLSRRFRDVYEESIAPYPGVVEMLEVISARCRIGVISNGDPAQQMRKLHRAGLSKFFPVVITSGEAGCAKPNRGIFDFTRARHGAGVNHFLYVGDRAELDGVGSRSAGWDSLILAHGPGVCSEFPCVKSAAEAMGYVLSWLTR